MRSLKSYWMLMTHVFMTRMFVGAARPIIGSFGRGHVLACTPNQADESVTGFAGSR